MDYSKNKQILQDFYSENGILEYFEKDNKYLESAFHEINEMWLQNLEQIKEVRYLMIAEAPLWGKDKSYIYNPNTPNTQFSHRGDLEYVTGISINSKHEFIDQCNDLGLLIIDISPFVLNVEDTTINYNSISKKQYRNLVKDTLPPTLNRN